MEERIHDKIKLLEFEKLKNEHTKLEFGLTKTRAETKGDNLGDLEKKEGTESLDSPIKSIRTLTIKFPTRPQGWGYFFSPLKRAFISKTFPEN